ncbi:MAG TPA: response regulator transcription factor [Candidatus Dormibacteraeota bacterium]|nr:response regulator transcription factor [Candidatus Dormibacteraeota bacterium]
MAVRVVLAEDNYLVREGVRQLIETQPELELVAVCADRDSLLRAVDEYRPDVVLTDIRMPPGNADEGLQVAASLRTSSPGTGVVVLSQFVEPEYALTLLEKGAAGRAYLLKERVADVAQLVNAVKEVARGGSVIDPLVVEALVAARTSESSPLRTLTPREREVLAEMAQGKNNGAIARALFLTERAVEKHINSIFSKLGLTEEVDVHRRVMATLMYLGTPDRKV